VHYGAAAPGTRSAFPKSRWHHPGAGGHSPAATHRHEETLDLIIGARPVDAAKGMELASIDKLVEGDLRTARFAYVENCWPPAKGRGAPGR